jgi:hypothetical protein
MKILRIWLKKFCEYPPRSLVFRLYGNYLDSVKCQWLFVIGDFLLAQLTNWFFRTLSRHTSILKSSIHCPKNFNSLLTKILISTLKQRIDQKWFYYNININIFYFVNDLAYCYHFCRILVIFSIRSRCRTSPNDGVVVSWFSALLKKVV